METFGWLSLVPPAVAVGLALWLRRVIPALIAGILCACGILYADRLASVPAIAIDQVVAVASVPDNLRLILFSVLVGGLVALLTQARAFEAFARIIERAPGGLRKRTAYGMTLGLCSTLFLETWSNVLIGGTTLRSLYDRLGISRERMAYFLHSFAIGVVALVPINSWAAFYMGLLRAQGIDRPFQFLIASLPFVVYCWLSLLLVVIVMATGWTIGPIRRFERAVRANTPDSGGSTQATRASDEPASDDSASDDKLTWPAARTVLLGMTLLTLIAMVLLGLTVTGDGDLRSGNGAAAVLYAVLAAIAVAALTLKLSGAMRLSEIEERVLAGCGGFAGVAVLILLALTLGALVKELGTGTYIAGLFEASVPRPLFAPLVFMVGALMSFATGTSYGTFAIMTPIAIPLAQATGADPHLLFGACIAGGVFGDNTSPISDTSVVTAVATEVRLIDHVATQLPYALIAAAASAMVFLLLGIVLD